MSRPKKYKLSAHLGVRVSDSDLKMVEMAQMKTAMNRSELIQRLIRDYLPSLTISLVKERDQRISNLEASLKEEGVSFRVK